MKSQQDIFSSRGWYLLALAIIAVYSWNVIGLADNTPKYDDLNDIFGFFKELAVASTFWQQCGAFFYPNNEHITATSHLLYWLQYQLLGTIDIRSLILAGHLVIILTGCLLGVSVNGQRRPFFFLVFVLAYINLYSWESSFKAMTALSNQSVILFAVASLLVLYRHQALLGGILLAWLASVSQGNGMLVWLVGGCLLALEPTWHSRRLPALCLWISSALLTALLYYWAKKTYSASLGPAPLADILHLWQKTPLLPLTSTLAFLGSTGLEKNSAPLAIVTGLLASTVILVCQRRQPASQTLLFYIAVFFVVSAVTASGLRGLIGGSEAVVMESRYKMYSLAFLVIAAVMLADNLPTIRHQRTAMLATVLLATLLQLDSYRQRPLVETQAARFRESYGHWMVDGDFKRHTIYFAPMSDYFLFIAHHLRLFDFFQLVRASQLLTATVPEVTKTPDAITAVCPQAADNPTACQFQLRHRGNAIAIQLSAQVNTATQGAVVLLCDSQPRVIRQITLPDLPVGESHWLIPEEQVPAGQYQAWLTTAAGTTCAASAPTPRDQPGLFNKKPRKVDEQMHQLFNGS